MQQTKSAAWLVLALAPCLGLGACAPSYSPNSYNSAAVQQANKVDQAVVVGVREVDISAQTNVGTLAGAGVGGIAGAPTGDTLGIGTALGALGGTVLGGLVGSTVEHQTSDSKGYEYIVRKSNGDLISVTQKDATPLAIGTHVLIIAGNQARIVPDYTVAVDSDKPAAPAKPEAPAPVAAETAAPAAAAETAAPAPAAETAAPASAHIAVTETKLPEEDAPAAVPEAPTAEPEAATSR